MVITTDINNLFAEVEKFYMKIKYGNRFFVEDKVLDIVKEKIPNLERIIPESQIYYRARIDYKKQNIIKNMDLSNYRSRLKHMDVLSEESKDAIKKFYSEKKLSEVEEKIKNNFIGFDAEHSSIPPVTSSGRAQPKYIRYLYVAEDYSTAVAEVRPQIGHIISLAKIEITKPLKVIDISDNIYSNNSNIIDELPDIYRTYNGNEQEMEKEIIFRFFLKKFSDPIKDEDDYILSNFTAALIHSLGYDGLRFKSSLNQNGYNVTLFDDCNCNFVSSQLLRVNNMQIDTDSLFFDEVNSPDLFF